MERTSLVALVLLVAAAPAAGAARSDYEYGQALAGSGWFDLAQDVFTGITNNSSLPADERATGQFGLAQLEVNRALQIADPEQRAAQSSAARERIQQFIDQYPEHRLAGMANAYLAYLIREDARTLARAARREPERLTQARDMLQEAIRRFDAAKSALEARGEPNLGDDPQNPDQAWIDWIEDYFGAVRELIVSRYTFGEIFSAFPETREDARSAYASVVATVDQFAWQYETFLIYYEVAPYAGRACWQLAIGAPPEEARQRWQQAWQWFGACQRLVTDPSFHGYDDIPELAGDGLMWMIRAKAAYAEANPTEAVRSYNEAVAIARDLFATYPSVAQTDAGKHITIEWARALARTGNRQQAESLLTDLLSTSTGSIFESLAYEALSEVAGADRPELLLETATSLINRGRLMEAAQKLRRAADLLPADRARDRADAWLRMGHCYLSQNLLLEATVCYSTILEDNSLRNADSAISQDAAVRRWRVAREIHRATGLAADQQRLAEFQQFGLSNFPQAFGDEVRLEQAIALRDAGDFQGAMDALSQIQPGTPAHQNAVALMSRTLFRQARDKINEALAAQSPANRDALRREAVDLSRQALPMFVQHYQNIRDAADAGDTDLRNGLNSLLLATWILSDPRMRDPQNQSVAVISELRDPAELLRISEEFMERFADVGRRFPETLSWPSTILRRRVTAVLETAIDLNNPDATLQAVAAEIHRLEDYYRASGGGTEDLTGALSSASARLSAAVNSLPEESEVKQSFMRAAQDYYMVRLNYMGSVPQSPNDQWQVAMYFLEQAQRRGDPAMFAQARQLVEMFMATAEEIDPTRASEANRVRATCYRQEGNLDRAIEVIERLVADDSRFSNFALGEEYADCLRDRAHRSGMPGGHADLVRSSEIYGQIAANLMRSNAFQSDNADIRRAIQGGYWRILYKWLDSMSEWNNDQSWNWFAARVAGRETGWDEGEFGMATQFNELMDRVGRAMNREWPAPVTPEPAPPPDMPEETPEEGGNP